MTHSGFIFSEKTLSMQETVFFSTTAFCRYRFCCIFLVRLKISKGIEVPHSIHSLPLFSLGWLFSASLHCVLHFSFMCIQNFSMSLQNQTGTRELFSYTFTHFSVFFLCFFSIWLILDCFYLSSEMLFCLAHQWIERFMVHDRITIYVYLDRK